MLTFVTLVVLFIYAYDTHTLAKTSVEQIDLVRRQYAFDNLRRNQAAYDCIFKANDDVISVLKSLADGTFGTKPQPPIYPPDWPDATSTLVQRKTAMSEPMISLGVRLRAIDLAVGAFSNASDSNEKRDLEKAVREAVADAVRDCNILRGALKTIGN